MCIIILIQSRYMCLWLQRKKVIAKLYYVYSVYNNCLEMPRQSILFILTNRRDSSHLSRVLYFLFCSGFPWPAGPTSAECILEGMRRADWHPPTRGTTRVARNCPQATQTLEGQGSACFCTLTNYCVSLEAHSWYFTNLTRKTFGFNRVLFSLFLINLYE